MALLSAPLPDVAAAAAVAEVLGELALARDRAHEADSQDPTPTASRLVHLEHLAAREARFGELARPLPAGVTA
ncbi:MAG: hypothetical protein ACRDYW_02615, partial [Acidimicrobiales bacterium]